MPTYLSFSRGVFKNIYMSFYPNNKSNCMAELVKESCHYLLMQCFY